MDRCYLSGAVDTPPDVKKSTGNYPTAGSNVTGVPATIPGPGWFYAITEEIRNCIVKSGQAPDAGNLAQLWQAIMSASHPVGSIYQSIDPTDPGTLFGGTWEPIKDRMLIGASSTYGVLSEGGAASHALSVDEMPSHDHSVGQGGVHSHTGQTTAAGSHKHAISSAGAHTHTRGSMDITASGLGVNNTTAYSTGGIKGAFYTGATSSGKGNATWDSVEIRFQASRAWTGETSSNGAHTHAEDAAGEHAHSVSIDNGGGHSHTIGKIGGGQPFNTISPYLAVYMWRRVA